MAKRKKEQDEDVVVTNENNKEIIAAICNQIGGAEILSSESIATMGFVSTGNLALNYVCSGKFLDGGIPLGRITEIYGSSSTGKTVVGTHILQGAQKSGGIAVLIDAESAYSISFGQTLGINPEELIYVQPECLEDCFRKIIEIVTLVRSRTKDMRPIVIVYDSLAASPSRKERTKISNNEDIGALMGHRALVCSDYLRNIAEYLSKQKVAVVIINQVREKIGVMYGNPETTAAGGRSLEFYCSLRLSCKGRGRIQDSKKRVIGIEMEVINTKNKVFTPFKSASGLELFFNRGINPVSGILKTLVDADKIEQSGAWYSIPGSDSKFQGKNIYKVLLEHPELIGAQSKEQIEEFVGINTEALEISNNEDLQIDETITED